MQNITELPGHWIVARCVANNTTRVASDVEKMGIGTAYVPKERIRKTKGYRERLVLPGYVPIHVEEESRRYDIRAHRFVFGDLIYPKDQARFAQQLERLCAAADAGVPISMHHGLVRGEQVRVCEGPFRGAVGILEHVGTRKLVIRVETLGDSVALELFDWPVEKVYDN